MERLVIWHTFLGLNNFPDLVTMVQEFIKKNPVSKLKLQLLKNIEMLKYERNLLHTASLETCKKISPHEKKIIIMVGLFMIIRSFSKKEMSISISYI